MSSIFSLSQITGTHLNVDFYAKPTNSNCLQFLKTVTVKQKILCKLKVENDASRYLIWNLLQFFICSSKITFRFEFGDAIFRVKESD